MRWTKIIIVRPLGLREIAVLRVLAGAQGVALTALGIAGQSAPVITQGAVYSILIRLDKNGMVRTTARERDGRRFYLLTPAGREALARVDAIRDAL